MILDRLWGRDAGLGSSVGCVGFVRVVRRRFGAWGLRSAGSVSSPWVGVRWTRTAGDKKTARRIVVFLEARRVLFADRHLEDERLCVESVLQIRQFLTEQIADCRPGRELEQTLRWMRNACRTFLDRAGPQGRHFNDHPG